MSKLIWLGVPSIVALLLVAVGPRLLDLYRLQHFVGASSVAYRADGGPWPHLTDVCVGCHGVKGNSQHQGYPSLAGQPATYIAAQLRGFAGAQRVNPTMGPLAMTLSEADIKLLASYFAKQPASANEFFTPAARVREKGGHLAQTLGCAACHGASLEGHDPFPRLAGQGYDYLLTQLDAFADGTRSDPSGVMNNLSVAASPDDRKALATYLAGLIPGNQNAKKGHQE